MSVADFLVVASAFACSVMQYVLVKYLINDGFTYSLCLAAVGLLCCFNFTAIFVDIFPVEGKPLSVGEQTKTIMPIALFHALSVGLTFSGLLWQYPTFLSLVTPMGAIFTGLLAILFRHRRVTPIAGMAAIPIVTGVVYQCVHVSECFLCNQVFGVVFILAGSLAISIKDVLREKILCDEKEMNSMALLYYLSPWALFMLLVASAVVEGRDPLIVLFRSELSFRFIFLATAFVCGAQPILMVYALERMNMKLTTIFSVATVPAIAWMAHLIAFDRIGMMQIIAYGVSAAGMYIFYNYGLIPKTARIYEEVEEDIELADDAVILGQDALDAPDSDLEDELKEELKTLDMRAKQ